MATDPYHVVQQEIQTSLQNAIQLRASYVRIRNMDVREDNEELKWARNELKATIATLEADLEDLEESVRIVESTDARMFGLDDAEVSKRRQYVGQVRKEIENMRAEVSSSAAQAQQRAPPPQSANEEEDHQAAWAQEEQQMMIQEQERTMDSLVGTLSNIAQQAGLMGQEIAEHNEMLDDLEQGVDKTDSKLSEASRKMRKFLRDSEAKGSGYCIVFLIIVLMILLLVVILI